MTITEMTTAQLLTIAENTVAAFTRYVGKTAEARAKKNKEGVSHQDCAAIFQLPFAVLAIRELEARGVSTGHGWLVEIYDEEREALG